MNCPTRENVKAFLIKEFYGVYDDNRARDLGRILFKYHDTYGLPVETSLQILHKIAEEEAEKMASPVLTYIENKIIEGAFNE